MIPAKFKADDEVRVVSPAVSRGFIPREQRQIAEERWGWLGLRISYAPNGEILGRFDSSPVEARVSDLRGAFADPEVKEMLPTLGGYNSNQLLAHLDYGLIRDNPKVLCGVRSVLAVEGIPKSAYHAVLQPGTRLGCIRFVSVWRWRCKR